MRSFMCAFGRRARYALFTAAAACGPAAADELAAVDALLRADRFDMALARASAHVEKHPNDAQMRILKGGSLTSMGKRAEALDVFSAMTRDFPNMAEPYNNLAVLHAATGNYDEARVALEKAVQINPGYATAHENLADLYIQLARRAYAKLVALNPGNASAAKWHALLEKGLRPGVDGVAAASVKTADGRRRLSDRAEAVLAAVRGWASAWSARNMVEYLNYYAPEFRPMGQEPRMQWEARRRALIESKARIDIGVGSPEVSFGAGQATVRFIQRYVSDSHVETSRKTLVMRKYEDGWKIVEERAGN